MHFPQSERFAWQSLTEKTDYTPSPMRFNPGSLRQIEWSKDHRGRYIQNHRRTAQAVQKKQFCDSERNFDWNTVRGAVPVPASNGLTTWQLVLTFVDGPVVVGVVSPTFSRFGSSMYGSQQSWCLKSTGYAHDPSGNFQACSKQAQETEAFPWDWDRSVVDLINSPTKQQSRHMNTSYGVESNGKSFASGDVLTFVADMDRRCLTITCDGETLVTFTQLPNVFYPAVSLHGHHDMARFVSKWVERYNPEELRLNQRMSRDSYATKHCLSSSENCTHCGTTCGKLIAAQKRELAPKGSACGLCGGTSACCAQHMGAHVRANRGRTRR
jgi:hypothetical protein